MGNAASRTARGGGGDDRQKAGKGDAKQKAKRTESAPWYDLRTPHDYDDDREPYKAAPYAVMLDWTGKRRLPMRILSVDGGGVRGIIPAMVLEYIEKKTGRSIADLFDVLVGTSVGGMICGILLIPDENGRPKYSAADAVKICVDNAKRLFPTSILRAIESQDGLTDARYSSEGIDTVMKEYFKDYKLKDSLRDLVIPAYDIELRRTIFFKSRQARADEKFDFPLWQVMRAASASPTYFEPAAVPTTMFKDDPKMKDRDRLYLIDAGLYCNSPAMCAYAEVQRNNLGRLRSNNDVLMVSLGTGVENDTYSYETVKHWGMIQWIKPMIDIMTQASSSVINYELSQMLEPEQYYRVNTTVEASRADMDDASTQNLEYLNQIGLALIEQQRERLDRLCEDLLKQAEIEDKYRTEIRRKSAVPVAGEQSASFEIHSVDKTVDQASSSGVAKLSAATTTGAEQGAGTP